MPKKNDPYMHIRFTVVLGSMIVMFLLGIFLGYSVSTDESSAKFDSDKDFTVTKEYVSVAGGSSFSTILVPAVDDQGNGVVTALDVQVSTGSGRVLTNIDKLFFWVDTQNSIRIATKVAQDLTGKVLSKYDIVYTVKANASVIEGGSAGAALTVATIAALENKSINNKIMITGTIEEDGRVGPIGEVVAKAIGAKDVGATLFLVPAGQGSSSVYRPEKKCYTESGIQICETRTISEKIYISKDVGIEVREVHNIKEAMNYFFGSSN